MNITPYLFILLLILMFIYYIRGELFGYRFLILDRNYPDVGLVKGRLVVVKYEEKVDEDDIVYYYDRVDDTTFKRFADSYKENYIGSVKYYFNFFDRLEELLIKYGFEKMGGVRDG